MADTDGQNDAEIDEMVRKFRPSPVRTALSVIAVIVGVFGSLALIVHTLTSLPTHSAASPDAGVAPEDADRTLIITELDADVRANPQVFTVADQTVIIAAEVPGEGVHFGTGFILSDGLIVSAAHIVSSASPEATYPVHVFCAGRDVDGGIIAYDGLRDVMAVFAPGCDGEDLVLDQRWLSVNDELHVAGFMFGPGLISRYHRNTSPIPTAAIREGDMPIEPTLAARLRGMRRARFPRFRAITGEAYPGNSGSPVFDGDGHIVGMLVVSDVRHARGFMVPAVTIIDVLRSNGLP